MKLVRVLLALILVPVCLFSAFGFFASFESRDWAEARVFYAVMSAGSLAYILWAGVATVREGRKAPGASRRLLRVRAYRPGIGSTEERIE